MPTCLITGASRGLGLEFTKQYLADGWKVIATCRQPEQAEALAQLTGDLEVQPLDVTDFARVEALGRELHGQAVDVLINSAGIYGPRDYTHDRVDYGAWADVMRVNVMAPLKVSALLFDNVRRSKQKRVVALSSLLGSIGENAAGGDYIYRSSKAALNAVMKSFAIDVRGSGVTVAMLHPGWVLTDMGGPQAPLEAEESVAGMRQVIADLAPDKSGHFFNYDGAEIAW